VSEGDITVDGHPAKRGDGLAISDQKQITLTASADSEILVIEVPGLVEAR
jgi:redox-sensitive bicupin YhaK (pirin superfamily)